MGNFLNRLFRLPNYISSSFVLIRVGKGAGIEIYKKGADESALKKIAVQFFKTVYKI